MTRMRLWRRPEGTEPIGWRYFRSPTFDLIEFGNSNLPLRIDISGNRTDRCQVSLPTSVRDQLEGKFWPALDRIASLTGRFHPAPAVASAACRQ